MADEKIKKEIETALDNLESWDVGNRVKKWITNSLRGAKSGSPKNALFKLAADGWYEENWQVNGVD